MAQIAGPYLFQAYYQSVKPKSAKRVWWALVKSENIFTHLPMVSEGSLLKVGQRVIDNLPTTETMEVGQEPTDNFWQPTVRFQEGVAIWRKNFDIDEVLTEDSDRIPGMDPVKFNSKAYLARLSYDIDNYFFNNNRVGGTINDPNGFIGIKYRLADTSGPNGTSKFGCNPACNFASHASLLLATLSSANAILLWFDIDRMLAHMDVKDGENVVMFAPPSAMWAIDALAKTATPAGGFEITKDVFGRTLRKYRNLEIRSCGVLAPQVGGLQTAPIIDTSQDINGWSAGDFQYTASANFYTSFFFIKRGSGEGEGGGLTAWQKRDPQARYERITGTRQWRWMHDQTTGLFYEDTRAMGRLYGIRVDGPSIN
jgi:hypothetical protein